MTNSSVSKEELVENNYGLVHACANKFRGRGVEYDDLFQAGCIGLIKAAGNFDSSRGFAFSTYAVPKIAGEIRRFLRDDGAVKVSRSIKEQAAQINVKRNMLIGLLGRDPSLTEISEQTGFSPEEIAMVENAMSAVESIHQSSGEDGFTLESVLTDTESEENMIEKMALRQAINRLPEREKNVIHLRYYHGLTQERIAKILSVSQVQISRIEKKAIARLKQLIS